MLARQPELWAAVWAGPGPPRWRLQEAVEHDLGAHTEVPSPACLWVQEQVWGRRSQQGGARRPSAWLLSGADRPRHRPAPAPGSGSVCGEGWSPHCAEASSLPPPGSATQVSPGPLEWDRLAAGGLCQVCEEHPGPGGSAVRVRLGRGRKRGRALGRSSPAPSWASVGRPWPRAPSPLGALGP